MVIKYRIYAEDDNENQISKSYVVRNPNSFSGLQAVGAVYKNMLP